MAELVAKASNQQSLFVGKPGNAARIYPEQAAVNTGWWLFGSDSLLMKFEHRLALVSQKDQHDAASPTSISLGLSRV